MTQYVQNGIDLADEDNILAQVSRLEAENERLRAVLTAASALLPELTLLEANCRNNCFNYPLGHVERIFANLRRAIEQAEAGDQS